MDISPDIDTLFRIPEVLSVRPSIIEDSVILMDVSGSILLTRFNLKPSMDK